jgi:hypothetical protein
LFCRKHQDKKKSSSPSKLEVRRHSRSSAIHPTSSVPENVTRLIEKGKEQKETEVTVKVDTEEDEHEGSGSELSASASSSGPVTAMDMSTMQLHVQTNLKMSTTLLNKKSPYTDTDKATPRRKTHC